MDRFEILEDYCISQLEDLEAAMPIIVPWRDQSPRLYEEALRFRHWLDVAYDPQAEKAADDAIIQRARTREWPKVDPSVGRVLAARLIQAVTVVEANALANERPGTTFPSGLPSDALTSALLIWWCYAMELVLPETGGSVAGQA